MCVSHVYVYVYISVYVYINMYVQILHIFKERVRNIKNTNYKVNRSKMFQ